jgi:hypothetical protein
MTRKQRANITPDDVGIAYLGDDGKLYHLTDYTPPPTEATVRFEQAGTFELKEGSLPKFQSFIRLIPETEVARRKRPVKLLSISKVKAMDEKKKGRPAGSKNKKRGDKPVPPVTPPPVIPLDRQQASGEVSVMQTIEDSKKAVKWAVVDPPQFIKDISKAFGDAGKQASGTPGPTSGPVTLKQGGEAAQNEANQGMDLNTDNIKPPMKVSEDHGPGQATDFDAELAKAKEDSEKRGI